MDQTYAYGDPNNGRTTAFYDTPDQAIAAYRPNIDPAYGDPIVRRRVWRSTNGNVGNMESVPQRREAVRMAQGSGQVTHVVPVWDGTLFCESIGAHAHCSITTRVADLRLRSRLSIMRTGAIFLRWPIES